MNHIDRQIEEGLKKDGQSRVEDFPVADRYSDSNNGTIYPQFCLDGDQHEWEAIYRPFGPYQSGLKVDRCKKCFWKHSVDDSD